MAGKDFTNQKEIKMQISDLTTNIINQHNPSKLTQQLPDLKENTELAKFNDKDVVSLSKALAACQLVQRTYGKQAGDLDKVAKIFARVLAEYDPQQVIEAIKRWLQESPEFPTPSDIVKMLDPAKKFDKELYIKFSQQYAKGEITEFSQGYEYMKEYEKHKLQEYKKWV